MGMDSIIAIKEFENINDIVTREGQFFMASVTAYVNDSVVYCGNVDCMFTYECGYSQYRITIDWLMSQEGLKSKGLFCSYNTNFQKFEYDNDELIITDKKTKIRIIFLSKE